MQNLAELADVATETAPDAITAGLLRREHLSRLLEALRAEGYTVIGPQIHDGAIVYDHLTSVNQLPCGWIDDQANGSYRIQQGSGSALFDYTVGPHSWKQFLYPAHQRLIAAERLTRGFTGSTDGMPDQRYAFFGVRSCDLHAIDLYDRVFLQHPYVDPNYKLRRQSCFIVAVNCGHAATTCFCASMNSGPRAKSGYDLAMTELPTGDTHRYLIEVGSQRGAEIMATVPYETATEADLQEAEKVVANASAHMGRALDVRGLKEMLYRNFEHPMWDSIAERCLSCANCTMVCPTCFCTTVEDTTDLSGSRAERWRRWDSCFTLDFSYIHGGSIRVSTKSRFRQWMTHKLAAWSDQFGIPGCVGCGRCITWCPAGIDITAEARAVRESEINGPCEFSRSTHDSSNP